MARTGKSLVDLAKEIERQANSKKDLIAPVSKLSVEVGDNNVPVLAVHSFAHAYLHRPKEVAPGVKVFAPSHWTAYA